MTDSPTLGESAAGREAAYAELLRLEADTSATAAPHDVPEIAVACAPMLCAVLCKDVAEVSVEEYRRACQVLTALSGVDPVRVGGECTKLESACVAQCNIWTVWASAGSAVGVALAKDAASMTSDDALTLACAMAPVHVQWATPHGCDATMRYAGITAEEFLQMHIAACMASMAGLAIAPDERNLALLPLLQEFLEASPGR
jgi:hypothetical protein